jgi:ammonium transporter, Amt family
MSSGGTPLGDDAIDEGSTAWVMASTALVLWMVPSLALF